MEIGWDKIIRLISGKADEKEKNEIAEWANEKSSRKKFLKDAIEFYSNEDELKISYYDVQQSWGKINPLIKKRRRFIFYSSAAAVALLAVTLFSYNGFIKEKDALLPHIKPGEEKASLMLAGSESIELGSKTKKLPENITIKNDLTTNKPTLVIDIKDRSSESLLAFNEIIVPKYAEYQINLEEGTKVWLNSETRLKFPLKFGKKEREVHVSGEAYFQVAHNPDKPFIVHLDDNTKIKVLGTELNIRTYDEELPQSTLISGSIEFIHKGTTTLVNPGESCVLDKNSGTVNKSEADIMRVIAWKNGEFVYRNETLESIIKDLSRWYNVNVEFEREELKSERFYLYFDRTTGFEEIIHQIKKTEKINYKYKNKTIVIF